MVRDRSGKEVAGGVREELREEGEEVRIELESIGEEGCKQGPDCLLHSVLCEWYVVVMAKARYGVIGKGRMEGACKE